MHYYVLALIILIVGGGVVADVLHGYECFGKDPSTISDNTTKSVKCESYGPDDAAARAGAFCHGPNNAFPNNTYMEFGCGKCPNGTLNTCKSCAAWNGAENSNCNNYTNPTFSFSCYRGGAPVICSNSSLIKDIHCWGPVPTYKKNNLNLTECGCGTCAEQLVKDPDAGWSLSECRTCNYNNCNGAGGIVAVITPLLAMLYLLM